MGNFIRLKNVSKTYGTGENQFFALKALDFEINQGEFVVILGPSGAGKSTLLNLLGGMDSPSSGEILINGQNITTYNDAQLTNYRAEAVGFIFQFYNLIPTLTALENVALVKDIVTNCFPPETVLAEVGLKRQINQFPAELSGGEQQRVSIARAICKKPFMLLCDEPTGALDSETGITILKLLKELSTNQQRTVIVVTHNALIAPTADRVIYVKNGGIEKIVVNPQPQEIDEVNW